MFIIGSRGTTFQKNLCPPSYFKDGHCPVLKRVEDVTRPSGLVVVFTPQPVRAVGVLF